MPISFNLHGIRRVSVVSELETEVAYHNVVTDASESIRRLFLSGGGFRANNISDENPLLLSNRSSTASTNSSESCEQSQFSGGLAVARRPSNVLTLDSLTATRSKAGEPRSVSVQSSSRQSVFVRLSANQARHKAVIAQKNLEWADVILSTSACQSGMAGFITTKKDGNWYESEYFFNLFPNAVKSKDLVYKELLAFYNSIRIWRRSLLQGRKVLFSTSEASVIKLLRSDRFNTQKVADDKIRLLTEIAKVQQGAQYELRIFQIDEEDLNASITFVLCRFGETAGKNEWHLRFQQMLQDEEKRKREAFKVTERIFPPAYFKD